MYWGPIDDESYQNVNWMQTVAVLLSGYIKL